MKHLFLLLFALVSLNAVAQYGPMKFAGPSTFGVAAMDAWQENECDTIIFEMTSMTEANITLPSMTYNAMMVTIPSVTIEGLQFTMDMDTHNAIFEDQTYTLTVVYEGAEKTVTGKSFVATYNGTDKTFDIETSLQYGSMPLDVTYKINAVYVKEGESGINQMQVQTSVVLRDLQGHLLTEPTSGQIYIKDGKKAINY